MNNGKVSFVVRIAVFSLLLTLQYGCGGDKKQAAEGKASAGPAKAEKASQPKGQAPEAAPKAVAKSTPKEAEAAPAPKKSAVETAKDALKAGDVTVASKALQTLREYIDKTPTASDLGDAAKLLTNESIERASRLLAENKVKEAHTAIRLILDNNGELVSGVAKGLVMGREASAKVAKFILSATLDDLVALREAAKAEGALGTAAARVLKHVEQPIRAFVKQRFKTVVERDKAVAAVFPNGEGLCKAARDANDATKCEAKFFGLSGADEIKAVPANLLALLRVATLARGMGETLAGLEELPMAKSQAADIPAKTSENSLRLPGVVLMLDAAGVQVSTRSYVDLSTGKVTGPVLPGKVVMTTDALAAADTPDAMAGLVASLNAVKASGSEVEKALYGDQSPNRPDTKNGSLIFDVAAGVPMAVTRKVLAAANSAGYSDIRYRRGAEERNLLAVPTSGAVIPDARSGRKEERPLIVHLTKDTADIFEAKGGEGKAPVESAKVALPRQAKRWYKGTRLFKITVTATGSDPIVQAVRSVRQASGSGTVIVVSSADDVPASRTLSVAAALAEARGPADQTKLGDVFPGQACSDESGGATQAGCRSLFPTIPPSFDVPKARGLTDEPVKKVVEKKPKPKPEPKPEAPKLGFCNKAGIKRVIRARTGSFKFCYERRLQLNNSLAGRVVGRLTIGSSGQVLSVSTSGSMPDKKVHECVKKQFKKLKFAPPENGGKCVVSYPFTFKP